MSTWTLEYNSQKLSLEAWGITSMHRTLRSLAQDEVLLKTEPSSDGSGFATGSTCVIYRGETRWFVGRVVSTPESTSPTYHEVEYRLAGVWWYLDHCVFEQEWTISNGEGVLSPQYKGRVVLFQKPDGNKASTRELMTEVLQFAISRGAPLQIGNILNEGEVTPPFSEKRDQSCAEIVDQALLWHPDAGSWVDYSTLPHPTLHIMRRSEMSRVSLTLGDGKSDSLDIHPRPDLQVPSVLLKYESTHQYDDEEWNTVVNDLAPQGASGEEFGALVMTLELSGSVTHLQKQYMKSEVVSESSGNWWEKKLPWLKDADNVTIEEGELLLAEDDSACSMTREIVRGSCPSWKDSHSVKAKAKALLSCKITNEEGGEFEYRQQPVSCLITATDLPTGTYTRVTSFTPAEDVPQGLAQAVWEALEPLQYQGSMELTEEEISTEARPSLLLDIAGGQTGWETMGAMVQEVHEDVGTGKTRILFGPAGYLGADKMLGLLRASRERVPSWRVGERSSGKASGNGSSEGSLETPNENSSQSGPLGTKLVLSMTREENEPAQVAIRCEDIPDACTSTVELREVDVCKNGELHKMLVLASEPWKEEEEV